MRRSFIIPGLLLIFSGAHAINYYPQFRDVQATFDELRILHQRYPAITLLDTVGYSQRDTLPIVQFVISRNVGVDEDEPVALFNGLTHAREPIGNEICLYAINWILQNYPAHPQARRYVDSMELRFIPMVNPDGWRYNTENQATWRKNMRDNLVNGAPFDPTFDGVDLGRNWDWHWSRVGSAAPGASDYFGPFPASESEIQAVMRVALRHKPVVGISYHSFGRYVFYPYTYFNGTATVRTPDHTTILEIAQGMTGAIGGYTAPQALTGAGQSSVWLYGAAGMLDFEVEVGGSFFPTTDSINVENVKNFNGIRYLLDRCFYSGITGHVLDSITRMPLKADVEILDLVGDSIVPRSSDSLYGRYHRLLQNNTYRLRVSKPGYVTKTISNISVVSNSLTNLDVLLVPIPVAIHTRMRNRADHPSQVPLFNLEGRRINRITGPHSVGRYFYRIRSK